MTKKLVCGCLTILLSLLLMGAPIVALASPSVSGASGVVRKALLLEGEETGVTYTQMSLPAGGVYNPSAKEKLLCMAEADLSNTRLSVDVINCGSYAVSTKRVAAAVADYNAAHNGKTVIAAMNGDLWMTAVNSNSGITKSLLKVPRGVMMVDREIWASQEIGMENASLSSGTPTTHTIPKAAFGVTSENQPIVGIPWIYPTVKNETTGEAISADGINRLPANDSVILYNHRCYTTNYALNDAFEIELEADHTAFTFSGTVVGRVKAIYPAGSSNRPAIGENTVLITARGSGIGEVASRFSVGDTVSIRCEVEDTFGNDHLWRDAVSVIGGHILLKAEDRVYTSATGTSEYPVALIGIKDDGKVLFCSVTAASDGVRLGVNDATVHALVEELGYNSVFFLDGGGSTTFVTLEEGSYTVRSGSSDGSPRAVINAVALVWNSSPVCEKQGALSHIRVQGDYSNIPGYHIPADLMTQVTGGRQDCTAVYDENEDAFRITVSRHTVDPYVTLDYSALGAVNAGDYPYVVLRVRTRRASASQLALYYYADKDLGASAQRVRTVAVQSGGEWQTCIADMRGAVGWNGRLNGIRLDVFDSAETQKGEVFFFGGITLCRSLEEAQRVALGGYLPEGAVRSYREYLGLIPPLPPLTEEPTKPNEPTPPEKTEEPKPPEEPLVGAFSGIPGYYLPADLLPMLAEESRGCAYFYSEETKAFSLDFSSAEDCRLTLDYRQTGRVRIESYPYLVIKLCTAGNAPLSLAVSWETESGDGASAALAVAGGGRWAYYVVRLWDQTPLTGEFKSLSLAPALGQASENSLLIGGVMLCRTEGEADRAVTGAYLPVGAVASYREFLQGGSFPTAEAPPNTEPPFSPLDEGNTEPVSAASEGCGASLFPVGAAVLLLLGAIVLLIEKDSPLSRTPWGRKEG